MTVRSLLSRGTTQFPLRPTTSRRRIGRLLACILLFAIALPRSAAAANYYWDGTAATNDFWNFNSGATNWSNSSSSISDPGTLPGNNNNANSDNVFFFAFPYTSGVTTELGASTSISSLTFLSGLGNTPATTVDGGGTFSLTLGSGGLSDQQGNGIITLSANTILGASQTWTNVSSNPVNVSGVLSGSSGNNITYIGSGTFNLSNADTYSGSTTVGIGVGSTLTGSGLTTLTLSGNGSIQNTSAITINGGASLTLDDTGTNLADRIADSVGITSNGGTITLLGTSSVATETAGTLTIGSGATSVVVTPGASAATLTFGSGTLNSFSRTAAGGTVNFSNATNGTIAAPLVTLDSTGLIGAWATIGDEISGSGALDYATVSGGNIVPYSAYNTGAIATWTTSSNVKVSSSQTITAAVGINSIYLTGAADVIGTGTAGAANTITLGNGGILSNIGTGTYTVNGNRIVTNATELGGNGFSAGASGNKATVITAAVGVPDIVINVAGSVNFSASPPTDTGALQISATFKDGANPTEGAVGSATTTTSSNVVTVTNTSELYPGVTVTGLTGLSGTQTITAILSATQFTVGGSATSGGTTSSEAFISHTGITKTGGGLLDLADGNNNQLSSTNTGPFTIDGGSVLINNDPDLGAVPAAFNAAAIVLNGGEIESTKGISFNVNRGITVGPQGGAMSYIGGATLTFTSKVTGPGSMTFSSNSEAGSTTFDLDTVANGSNYQGATTLFTKSGSNLTWMLAEQIPNSSAVTVTGPSLSSAGTVNMAGFAETIGSLASAAGASGTGLGTITNLGAFTTGSNNLSTTYGGTISGTSGTFTKVGSGTQTLSGNNSYGSNTNINAGTLLISGSPTGAGAITVGQASAADMGATLAGSGTVVAAVLVNTNGHLSPNNSAGGVSTFTINNALNMSGGSILDYDFGATNGGTSSFSPSDVFKVTGAQGNLTINNASSNVILNITPLTGFGPGVYDLIDASTSGGNINIQSTSNFTVNAANSNFFYYVLTPGQSQGSYTNPSGSRDVELLVVNNPNPQVTWTGNAGSGGNATWDTTSNNWTPGNYADGDRVVFNNNGTNTNISLGGSTFTPSSLTFSNGVSVPYTLSNGTITGATTTLTKNSAGTLTLANTNTYGGATQINSGTLRVTGSIGAASAVTVGGTVAGGAVGSPTLSGNGTINGPVTVTGAATGSVAGSLAPSGFTGSSGTTLNLGGPLTINTGSILNFNLSNSTSSGNDQISIAGSGAVNYGTGGVLNLNDYSGSLALGTYTLINDASSTTPSGGTGWTVGTNSDPNSASRVYTISVIGKNLDLSVGQTLSWGGENGSAWDTGTTNWFAGSTPSLFFAAGSIVSFNDTQFSGGPAVTNSNITISQTGGVSPLSVTFNNTNTVVPYTLTSSDSGNLGITGATGLTMAGTGTVTLIGANTYTGTTALNAGTLIIGNNNSLGSASGTIAPLTFNGGTLRYAPSSTNADISARTVTISGGGATIDLNGNTVAYASGIGNGGSGNLTVMDSGSGGVLNLNGVNSYTGATAINSGTVSVGPSGALSSSGALSIASGAVGQFQNPAQTVASLSGAGTLRLNGNGGVGTALTITNGGGNTFSGAIGGSTGSINLAAGALTLSNVASSYGGGTTVNGNLTVVSSGGTQLGTGIVNVGGTLTLGGGVQGLAGTYYNIGRVGGGPFSTLTGAGDAAITGTGNANYASLALLNAYIPTLASTATTIVTANSTATTVNSGANFDLGSTGLGFPAPFTTVTGTAATNFQAIYTGYIHITTPGTYTFGTNSDDGSVIFVNGGGSSPTTNVGMPTVNNNVDQGDLTNIAQRSGQYTFTTAGYYPIVAAYYQGTGGDGYQNFFASGTVTAASMTSSFLMSNSILYTAPPVSTTIAGLSGSGTVNLNGLSTLQIGTSSTPSSFAGSFTGNGAGAITIGGGTTFTLTGSSASTFTSPITISNGTLRVTSTGTGNAPVFVGDGTGASPAFLSGTGTIAGPVTVNGPGGGTSGGTLVGVGASQGGGTLSLAAGLSLLDGSSLSYNLGTPNGTANPATTALIATSGPTNSLAAGTTNSSVNTVTVSFSNPSVGTYDLLSYTGSANTGAFVLDSNSIANSAGLTFQLVPGAGQLDLLVSTPPIIWSGVNVDGSGNAAWDYSTTNWVKADGTPVNYMDPNGVVTFGDFYPNGQTVTNSNVVIQDGGVKPLVVTLNGSGLGNGGVDYTFSDAAGANPLGIGGPASIILNAGATGNETVTFLGANSFTGTVSINAGYLNVENNAGLGSSSGVTVANGAVLQLQSPDGTTPVVAGTGVPLAITGNGDGFGALQNVLGNNTYAGLITGNGTIASNDPSGSLTLTGGLNPQGNTLTITGSGPVNINSTGVSGSVGTIDYNGSSTLTLNAANTFTGLTQIDGSGQFIVSNTGLLNGNLTYNSSATSTINGTLNGASVVLNSTSGTLILNGANTYGGGTTLAGGTVRVGVSSSPASGPLVSGALGTGLVRVNSGTVQDNGAAITLGNSVSLNGSATFSSSGSGSLTFDGTSASPVATFAVAGASSLTVNNTTTINDVISGSANLAVAGAGTLILGSVSGNTFTGGTTINSGIVQLNNANALQNSVVTLNTSTGLTFNAGIGGVNLGGLSGSGNLTMSDLSSPSSPNVALTLGNSNSVGSSSGSYAGSLTASTLTKVGTNTQTLSGNNSFTGAVTVNSGTLAVVPATSGSPLGTAPVTLSGGTLSLQGGGLQGYWYNTNANNAPGAGQNSYADQTTMLTHFAALGTPTVTANSTATTVNNGLNFDFGPTGAGFPAPFNTTNTQSEAYYQGYINIPTAGNYTFGLDSDDGSMLFIDGATVVTNNRNQGIGANILAGNPGIQAVGTATLTAGFHSIVFGYNNTGGGFGLDVYFNSGSSVSDTEFLPNSLLSTTQTAQDYSANNVSVTSNSTINVSTTATLGTLNISGSTLTVSGAAGLTMGATALSGNPTFNVSSPFGSLTLGALSDGGTPRTINLTGAGTVALAAPATSLVQGTLVNINNGTLNSNATGALGSFAQVYNAGSLGIGASQTISSLSGPAATITLANVVSGGGTVRLGNNTLTIGNTDNITPASSFAGTISDSGSGTLVKNGTGTLTLTGANTYHGGTTINAGSVAAGNNSALGSGLVTLAGGTLQLAPATGGSGNAIGIHWNTDQNGNQVGSVAANATAGAPGFAIQNWNNAFNPTARATETTANVVSPIAGTLVNNLGVATSTTVSYSGGGNYSSGNYTTPDNSLMGTFLNDGVANTGTGNTVTFSNIPYASYEVVAYVGSEGGTANTRPGGVTIGSAPTFYFQTDTFPGSSPYTYVQITNTTNGTYPGGNYAVVSGLSGSSLTVTDGNVTNDSNVGLPAIEIIDTSPSPTIALANSIAVSQSSTIALNGTTGDSVGPLSIGSSTLSITGTSTGSGVPYMLTAGATTLTGNPTFDVANNGAGTGTLILGALNDGGTARTITITDNGAVTLGAAATSLVAGTVVNVNNGTLNANATGALGATATVNIASGGSLALGANQTLSSLNGAGSVNLNSNTLTVGSTDSLASSFGGTISGAGGSLRVASGSLTLTSINTNSYTGSTTVNGGTLLVNSLLSSTSSVTVGGASATGSPSLGGSGAISPTGGPVLVNAAGGGAAGHIAPSGFGLSGPSTVATTTFANGLTLASGLAQATDGPQLDMLVSSSFGSDLINVTGGTLSVGNNVIVNIDAFGGALLPGNYPLIDYGTATGVSNISTWTVGTHTGDTGNTYSFANVGGNQIDLVVAIGVATGSGQWISNSDQLWSTGANWDSGTHPDGPTQSATFGTGTQTHVNIDASYTVGVLHFTSGSLYSLNSTTSGNGLTLNNGPSADAQVNVDGGSAADTLNTHVAMASSTGNTTFTIQPNSSLVVSAFNAVSSNLSLTGSNQGITLAGGGTLELAAKNTYTGPTNVNNGTLRIDAGAVIASTAITVKAGGMLQLAGTTNALPAAANVATKGGGPGVDGAVSLTGTATESIDAITGDSSVNGDGAQVYTGSTTVGDGTNVASLTATQILQNTLTINANSTVTIAPSAGAGGGVVAAASTASVASAASAASADSTGDSGSDPLSAIQAAIAAGSISSSTGQRLENRIAAIERLAATDPGLDVSLLESRVLAALPSSSILPSTDASPLADGGSSLLAADTSAFASGSSGASATFAAGASFSGSPAAVPEPSTLLLAALGGLGLAFAARRRVRGRNC